MKKLTILLVFILASFITYSQSNAVKLNPLSLFVATGNLSYERVVSEKGSVQLGFFYSGIKVQTFRFSGWGITPEYRFYITSTAPEGFYVAPYFRYSSFSITESSIDPPSKASIAVMSGGAVVGWQFVIKEKMTLEGFIGPKLSTISSFNVQSGNLTVDEIPAFGGGFGVRAGMNIGFAF